MAAAPSAADLLYDWQVWVYFAVLGASLRHQLRRTTLARCAIATAIVSATWFYILRFTVDYKASGGADLFDDAYRDVLKGPSAGASLQLLTWVVVATCWARNEPVALVGTGALGAMSAAFALTPVRPTRARRVAATHASSTLFGLACVAAVSRLGPSFGIALRALHVAVALPFLLPARGPTIDERAFYVALGIAVALRRDGLGVPETDCQKSIFIDLAACALLTLVEIGQRRGLFAAVVAAVVSLVASPGAALAFHLAVAGGEAPRREGPLRIAFVHPDLGIGGAGPRGEEIRRRGHRGA